MKNELFELEKKYWNGMAAHNYDTVKGLTKFPCIVAGKQGVMSVTEPAFKKMFDSGSGKNMKVNGLSEEQIEVGTDHAMVAYLIELESDGVSMKCACTSTWVKENGEWLCAMHTESDLEEKKDK